MIFLCRKTGELEVGKMRKITLCGICVTAFLFISSFASAGITIAAMNLDIEQAIWFDATTDQFQLIDVFDTGGDGVTVIKVEVGHIRSWGSAVPDYTFVGTVEITPSDVDANYGSLAGFQNSSTSDGPSIITIKATNMFEIANPANVIINDPAGETLLVAAMNFDPLPWYIATDGVPNNMAGTTHYETTGTGPAVEISDFQATFLLPNSSPTPVDFLGSDDLICGEPVIKILAEEVPEPATLILLVTGSCLLMKRK